MKGKITISRPQYGDERKKICIQVEDVDSRVSFLEVQMDLDKFTEAVTGLSYVDCDLTVRNLNAVGKVKESMDIEFPLPDGSTYRSNDAALAELPKYTPDGWEAATYFSSQTSFYTKDGVMFARTNIYRWVNIGDINEK